MLNVQFNRTGPLLVLHQAADSLYQHFCVAFLVYVLIIPDSVRAGAKPYRIGLLFKHKNGDFGAISVNERSCAAPISKVEVVTYRRGVHTIPESFWCRHENHTQGRI